MAKVETIRFITPRGTLHYPWLRTPDTRFSDGAAGKYKCGIILAPDDAQELMDAIIGLVDRFYKDICDAAKPQDRSKIVKAYPWKEEYNGDIATGMLIFTAKSDYAPKLVDAKNADLPEEVNPYGGSVGRLSLNLKPYFMQSTKSVGVSCYLNGVQLFTIVEGGGASGFSAEPETSGVRPEDIPDFD